MDPESAVIVTEKYDKTIIVRNIVAKIIKQNTAFQNAHHSQGAPNILMKNQHYLSEKRMKFLSFLYLCAHCWFEMSATIFFTS
jgi:hypothetical protein